MKHATPENTIILDNNPVSYVEEKLNGVPIRNWEPLSEEIVTKEDRSLLDFMEFMESPKVLNTSDLRTIKFKTF
jgi:TFIIF-interacting CTD phosphatase-like protein